MSDSLRDEVRAALARNDNAPLRTCPRCGRTEHTPAAQQLKARHDLLVAVENAITADARGRVKTGELKGTISHTECGPFLRARNAVPDDQVLSKPIGRYDCVAVQGDAVHSGQT